MDKMTFLFPLLICLIFIIFCNVVHAEIFSGSFLVGVEEKLISEQMNLAEYAENIKNIKIRKKNNQY